jgi:hypothetical protein
VKLPALLEKKSGSTKIKITAIPIRAPRFRVEDLSGLPVGNQEARLEALAEGAVDWRGDFVRLVVSSLMDGKLVERVREALGARAFQAVVLRAARAEQRADVHAGLDRAELLRRYVAARPPEGLDAKAVLAAGVRLAGNGA